MSTPRRRLSAGAEVSGTGVHFRVWAPKQERLAVVVTPDRVFPLEREENGYFSGFAEGVKPGDRYQWRIGDDPKLYPDQSSRFQPEGPDGPSEVVDPTFAWTDASWKGIDGLRGQVIYELHVGTFTREGTFAAAAHQLRELHRIGITLIELMPIAEFPGKFGWGYDGVDLYAPTNLYGRPEDLRAFVDRAHAVGIGVILDVVYNHLGPCGNYLPVLSDAYFTEKYENEWGAAIDFETSTEARAYFAENGAYWVDEFHFDGLRLDATQSIHDASTRHVITELAAKARAATTRSIVIVAENEPQLPKLVRPEPIGYGLDGLWNDDFHHSARVAATGKNEAYYSNTKGTPQELISAIKWGYLYQGQFYPWQGNGRGAPALDIAPERFILYLQNHDQVANSAGGKRLGKLTSPGRVRTLTALTLLAPATPMLFQGQEFGASAPFLYFADHDRDLAKLVRKGRLTFLAQFPSMVHAEEIPPDDPRAFEESKLDFRERERHREIYDLHIDLLKLRRDTPAFAAQRVDNLGASVLGPEAFLLRFATGTGDDRLVVVNMGRELDIAGIAEPLIAPLEGTDWEVAFSTESTRYGGGGIPLATLDCITAPGHSTTVFAPIPRRPRATKKKVNQ